MLSEIQEEMYQGEAKINTIFRLMSVLTVFIALLGLFGLSSFSTEQRSHEIGIRKVNGASIGDIMVLLYKEFFWLILVAFIIAIPVAVWRLSIWLQTSFIYYTDIHWYSVLIAGVSALLVGLVTITYHVLRAASGNPVDAIKYE
jgi:putative ABC transport system permease protein